VNYAEAIKEVLNITAQTMAVFGDAKSRYYFQFIKRGDGLDWWMAWMCAWEAEMQDWCEMAVIMVLINCLLI